MGLDSYLYRMPRYKGVTVHDVHAIEEYLNWQREKAEGNEYADCKTLKEWCDIDESELPSQEIIDYYKQFYTKCYSDWDTEHKYGWYSIMKQVGYWRKANEIHNWFVESVQDGEDDCEYHNECTRGILEDLLHTCKVVFDSCATTYSKIHIEDRATENGLEPIYTDGQVLIDSSIAEELLPRCRGFFFGGDSYDEYYVSDIVDTIKIIENVLATTDFETQMVFYVSSW